MSRIGKKPVVIPAGVTAKVEGQTIAVKGAKGELKFAAPDEVSVSLDGNAVKVEPHGEDKRARAMWGMTRAQIANLVAGVTKGFERKLEINGVGYKAAVAGKNLQLSLGYSHDIDLSDSGRRHDHDAEADRNHDRRHRQAAGRPGRRRNPRVPRSRALQGQGREICRRIHLPQGRQEEVRSAAMAKDNKSTERRKARVRRAIARQRAAASRGCQRLPLVEADLCADHRRREGRARSPRPRRSRRRCARR